MKKLLLLTAILFGAAYSASAQYYYNNNNNSNGPVDRFGFGISSGFATGPVSGAFPETGAITLKFEMPINKSKLSLLLSTGYSFFVSNGGYEVDYGSYGYGGGSYYSGDMAAFIPVEVGLKLYVAPRFFIEGDAGVSFNVNGNSSFYTNKPTDFVYSPAMGYSFPFGYSGRSNMDLSVLYENRPEAGGGYSQVALRAVWNFALSSHR